jgi:hypothetical protein
MPKKVFISYSHKDEIHRESLEEHLSMLKRQNIISVWHDRKITPGDDWKKRIDENLESADIVIFLVSSSFLGSDYCYDVEVKRAMERHEEGSAKIISIIVRNCDWNECEFAKYQAVPTDARPITTWEDIDTAWLDAIKGLKRYVKEFSPQLIPADIMMIKNDITPSDSQLIWLDDTEIALTHRKADQIKLSDIYVSPDLEYSDKLKSKEINFINSDTVFEKPGYFLLSGEEQQGKTTLLKHGFKELLKKNYLPVYIDAKSVKNSDLSKLLQQEVGKQYKNLPYATYEASSNKALLIDNFELIELNQKFRNLFIENVNETFEWVIVTCHSSFSYISTEIPSLNEYQEAELLCFGNFKREEIVQKWISLGVEESIDDSDLYSQCDELKAQLDTVIKKNIVPPKPIYILMLMQMFEAYAQQNLELTSYGHCYQQLIYQSFEKAGIKGKDYEKYLNVLTEMAWAIFKQGNGLNKYQLDVFFRDYGQTYLSVDKVEVLSNLTAHSILMEKDSRVEFKYPYIYYFFAGKKIAEGFSESDDIKEEVRRLLENLYREDFANILIFITHHTKDSWVLNEIKTILFSLFKDQNRASLNKEQLSFMDDFIKLIPELVLEKREIQKERDNHNKKLDEIERKQNADNMESADILVDINKTFKGMEIAGQIIRNRHATLTRNALYELANSGISTGLRFLDYFINISDIAKFDIVRLIEAQLAEHPNLNNSEIQTHAQNAYLHINYGVINGVVRKIASSIGSKEAAEIYNELEEQEKTPAYTLINQSIEFQFKRILDISSVEKTAEKLKNNPVCLRILKEMVIQHIYMFPVEYKAKQKLSALLDISVQQQRFMDRKKIGKG